MRRLLYLGPEHRDVVDLLHREAPAWAMCSTLADLAAAMPGEHPQALVTLLASPGEIQQALHIVDQYGPGLPVVVVSPTELPSPLRQEIFTLLGDRGTLLAPVELAALRATLRSWCQASAETTSLDSTALARAYARGGRDLADRVVEVLLNSGPGLVARAQSCWRRGEAQQCINCLQSLSQQAGGVGAVDVSEAAEEILDELIEGAHVDDEQWIVLERALESTLRFLGEQKRQDRTV